MARCGCIAECNCSFHDGACTKIKVVSTSGGTVCSSSPSYGVNVVTDNQTVFCGANGLNALLNTLDTNTVDLEGNGTVATPLEAHVIRTPDGNVPDPDALGTGNLVKEIAGPGGGIYVSCEDVQDCVGAAIDVITSDCLNYDDANNTISISICGEPNGIECALAGDPACPAGGLLVFPSADANNSLTFGTDGRLYAPAASLIPGECITFTGAGTQADPFVITPLVAPELNGVECVPGQGLLVTPSSDLNNGLVFGTDTRLFINKCPLTLAGSQVLIGNAGPCFELVGGDCNVPMVATLRISDDVCQGLQCRTDGLFVEVDQTELPATVTRTDNFGPLGPFNGAGQQITFEGPTCITITNPSPCRDMIATALMEGFADIGRTTGNFRIQFDASTAGPGGPFFNVSQVIILSTPVNTPAYRITGNAVYSEDFPTIGPGGSVQSCFRMRVVLGNPAVVNGRVFNAQRTISFVGRWAE